MLTLEMFKNMIRFSLAYVHVCTCNSCTYGCHVLTCIHMFACHFATCTCMLSLVKFYIQHTHARLIIGCKCVYMYDPVGNVLTIKNCCG